MELVRSFSNISFFYRFSIVFYRNRTRTFKNYYSKYERRYWKPIDFPAKNEYYSRTVSSSAQTFPYLANTLDTRCHDRRPSFHQSSKQNPQLPVEEA